MSRESLVALQNECERSYRIAHEVWCESGKPPAVWPDERDHAAWPDRRAIDAHWAKRGGGDC